MKDCEQAALSRGLDYDFSLKSLNNIMKAECGENKTIDIHSIGFNSDHFYDGTHTTDLGSQYIGELIFEQMKSKKLLNILN